MRSLNCRVVRFWWQKAPNDVARGTALHLALRCYLTRPDLAPMLSLATGLDPEELVLVAEHANVPKTWLNAAGYMDIHCGSTVLGRTAAGAELPGTIDLLAVGPSGCLLIDHKSGGMGDGLGPYWPQLSTYAGVVRGLLPAPPLQGGAEFWIEHGQLSVVDLAQDQVIATPPGVN